MGSRLSCRPTLKLHSSHPRSSSQPPPLPHSRYGDPILRICIRTIPQEGNNIKPSHRTQRFRCKIGQMKGVTNGTLLGDGEEIKKNFSNLFTSDMKGTMQGSVRVKWRCSSHGHPPNLIHHLAGTPVLCPRNSRAHLASHSSVFSKAEKNGAIPGCLLDIVPPSFRSGSSSFNTRLLSRFQLSGKVFRFHSLTAANCKLRIQTPPSVLSSHHLRFFSSSSSSCVLHRPLLHFFCHLS